MSSSEDYTKRTDKIRKELNTLRKDINYRDEQQKRGDATYTLDAEINGQFNQIVFISFTQDEEMQVVETMANNFKTSFKDYGLTLAQATKRYKVYDTLLNDRNTLKRTYDSLFQKKTTQRALMTNNVDAPSVNMQGFSLMKNMMPKK